MDWYNGYCIIGPYQNCIHNTIGMDWYGIMTIGYQSYSKSNTMDWYGPYYSIKIVYKKSLDEMDTVSLDHIKIVYKIPLVWCSSYYYSIKKTILIAKWIPGMTRCFCALGWRLPSGWSTVPKGERGVVEVVLIAGDPRYVIGNNRRKGWLIMVDVGW